jgi:hypothetical protein
MKTKTLAITALLTLCLAAACAGLHAGDSTPDTEANRIRAIEGKRLLALVNGRVEDAKQYHASDFQLISPGGMAFTRDEYLGAIASGKLKYLVFAAVSPIEVRLHGDAAVIRYRSRIRIAWEGKNEELFRCWHTDLYEMHDGQWQIVWSQVTGDGGAEVEPSTLAAERGEPTLSRTKAAANGSSVDTINATP